MSELPPTKGYAAYVVLAVTMFLTLPLWREFHEPGQPIWNAFLAIFLVALTIASFSLVRFLQRNRLDVGEARFTSADPSDANAQK